MYEITFQNHFDKNMLHRGNTENCQGVIFKKNSLKNVSENAR